MNYFQDYCSEYAKKEDDWYDAHTTIKEKRDETDDDELFLSESNICQELANINNLYDTIERLSTIYISKHHHNIHIKSSTFSKNIGTYGGAININAFSGKYGMNLNTYINIGTMALSSNTFEENYAYFSGGAIYMNLPYLLQTDNLKGKYI